VIRLAESHEHTDNDNEEGSLLVDRGVMVVVDNESIMVEADDAIRSSPESIRQIHMASPKAPSCSSARQRRTLRRRNRPTRCCGPQTASSIEAFRGGSFLNATLKDIIQYKLK